MRNLLVVILVAGLGSLALGADYEWKNLQGDNDFHNAYNWDPNRIDVLGGSSGDNLVLCMSGADAPVISQDTTGRQFRINYYNADAELNVVSGYATFGSIYTGYTVGTTGIINVSGGILETSPDYLTLGTKGVGILNITGGMVRPNRMTLAANPGAYAEINISGDSVLQVTADINMHADGEQALSWVGADCAVTARAMVFGSSNIEMSFMLDGGRGVGDGFFLRENGSAVSASVQGVINASFMGTAVPGYYPIISGLGLVEDLTGGNLLESSLPSQGWSYQIVEGRFNRNELQLVYIPLTAQSVEWTNGTANQQWSTSGNWTSVPTANDFVTIDKGGLDAPVVTGSALGAFVTVGLLHDAEVAIDGGTAEFANLYITANSGVTGAVTVDNGGTLDVAREIIVGDEGVGSLNIVDSSVSCYNMFVSDSEDGEGALVVSGNSSLDVDHWLVLDMDSEAASFTLSGSAATVHLGGAKFYGDSTTTFLMDGVMGVGSGIVVDTDIYITGNFTVAGNTVDGTYTLVTAPVITVNDSETDPLLTEPLQTYEVVDFGTYQELQVTIQESPTTCEAVIAAELALVGDVNSDCYVNLEDFALLTGNWLMCNDPEDVSCIPNW